MEQQAMEQQARHPVRKGVQRQFSKILDRLIQDLSDLRHESALSFEDTVPADGGDHVAKERDQVLHQTQATRS